MRFSKFDRMFVPFLICVLLFSIVWDSAMITFGLENSTAWIIWYFIQIPLNGVAIIFLLRILEEIMFYRRMA